MTSPAFTVDIQNLRALRRVRWSPEGACALIGANGAGKTTLLLCLKLLRAALDRGLPEAVTTVLGGGYNLKCWDAPEDEPVHVGLDVGDLSWRVRLLPRAPTVDYQTDESLHRGDEVIFSKDSLGDFTYRGERFAPDERLGLRALLDAQRDDPDVHRVADLIRRMTVFHDPDLWSLRYQGARTTDDRHLHSRGTNAFTMLRRWLQERAHRHRYAFVLEGLKAAFPGLIVDMDFKEAGQTIVAQVFRPGREQPSPMASEANGLLAMLVLLCDVAAAEEGGVVAIDEPENALHPYAIRAFLRRASAWARGQRLTILLSTHSTVLLDELSAAPSQVYVLHPGAEEAPIPLNRFKDPDWLSNFRLGRLYADGEIGSNDDATG